MLFSSTISSSVPLPSPPETTTTTTRTTSSSIARRGKTFETNKIDGQISPNNTNENDNKDEPAACTAPSCPIPFPHYHIKRTKSEIQLQEQMVMAEIRDRIMICRIAQGMKQHVDDDESVVNSGPYMNLDATPFASQPSEATVLNAHTSSNATSFDLNTIPTPTNITTATAPPNTAPDKDDSSATNIERTSLSCECIFDLEE